MCCNEEIPSQDKIYDALYENMYNRERNASLIVTSDQLTNSVSLTKKLNHFDNVKGGGAADSLKQNKVGEQNAYFSLDEENNNEI